MPPFNAYDSPAADGIVGTLLAALRRVSNVPVGVVTLTTAEADFLRRAGLPSAVPGMWTVSPLPPTWLLLRYPALKALTARCDAPTPPTAPSPALTHYRRVPVVSPWHWLTSTISPDQRRLLASIVAHGATDLSKRTLQQRLHRLCAARFNRAVDQLVARGVLRRIGPRVQVVAPLDALRTTVTAVSQRPTPRTQASAKRRRSATATRHRAYTPRPLPPRGTSAWGRSMRAKKAGLRRQATARARGECATAAATRARTRGRVAAR